MLHICILLHLLYHFFITILIFFLPPPPEPVENTLNHRAALALICHRMSPISQGFLCRHHITVTPEI